MKEQKNNRINILLSIIIPIIVILIGFFWGGFEPFGSKDILTVSGNEEMIPYFYEMWDAARSGNLLFFSSRVGSGYDFSTVITYYISDPTNLIVLIFPKSAMLSVLDILFVIKISLASFFLYLFLNYHKNNNESSFINMAISVAYSLSGYMLSSGMNITFTSAIIMVPLVMLGIEKIHREQKPFLYIVSMSLTVFFSFRLSLIVFIFSYIYLAVFEYKSNRQFVTTLLFKSLSDILVIGISFVVVFNSFSSTFFENDYSLFFPKFKINTSFVQLLARLLYSDLHISFFMLVLAMIYVLIKDMNMWKKVRTITLYILLFFATYVSTATYLLSGFADCMSGACGLGFVFLTAVMAQETLVYYANTLKKTIVRYIIPILIIIEAVGVCSARVVTIGKDSLAYTDSNTYRLQNCIDTIYSWDYSAKILPFDTTTSYATPISNYILGYNYIIQMNEEDILDENLVFVQCVDGFNIYKDPDVIPGNKKVSDSFADWTSDADFVFASCNELTDRLLGLGEVFEAAEDDISVLPDISDKTGNTTKLVYTFEDKGDYYVNMYHITHLGELEENENREISYNVSAVALRDDILSRESVRFDNDVYHKFTQVSGDNYYLIPYDVAGCHRFSGMTGRVYEKNIFGDKATLLEGASEDISITYYPVTFYRGIIVSIVTLLITILSFIILKLKNIQFKVSEKTQSRVERFIKDNRVYIYTLLLSIAIYILIIFINHCIPFGKNSAIISDGFVEDYPTNINLIQKLKRFEFSSVDYSLGYQRGGVGLSSFTYFLNPIRLILLLFPDEQGLLAFNTLYVVYFVLTGQSMLFYLIHRPHTGKMVKRELKLIPIAMCYNLSSFVLCYYSFAGFLEMAVILPLIMLATEKLIYEGKYIFYTLIMAYFMVMGTYFAFLLCIFLFMYFFTLDHQSVKGLIRNGFRFTVFSLIAAGIASFTLLSFYRSVTNSGYIEQDTTNTTSINYLTHNLLGNIYDIQVIHRISQTNSDTTVANTYCGLLAILALPLFFCVKKISLSSKIRRVFLLFVLYFAYGNELLNYIFHGFHFQSLVPNRFSIFFIFVLITVLYDVVCNYMDVFNKESVVAYLIFSGLVLLGIYYKGGGTMFGRLISVGFIFVYFICIFRGYTKGNYYHYTKLLLLFLGVELAFSCVNTVRTAFYGLTIPTTTLDAISFYSDRYDLKDNSLTRASFITDSSNNISAVTGFNSADTFTSTLQSQQIDLTDTWGLEHNTNYISYGVGNPLADIMLNNRYFFINSNYISQTIPAYLKKLETKNNITLYENPYVAGIGIILPKELKDIDIHSFDNPFEYQNAISQSLVGENLYTFIDTSLYSVVLVDGKSLSYEITDTDEFKDSIFANVNNEKEDGIKCLYASAYERMYFVGSFSQTDEIPWISISLTLAEEKHYNNSSNIDDARVAILNVSTLEKIKEYVQNNRMTNAVADGYKIVGTVDATEDSYVYIPIPSYSGWDVELDGNKIERDDILSGVSIIVPSGKHTIRFTKMGGVNFKPYILTIVSIIILIVIYVLDRYIYLSKDSKEKNTETV
ncbi:Uncharacterized membrane protein YfhO [Lachnospiraceae bacterium NE2001]|nr:Uncharacterized membrane protein YfhO [Lachnospiraceae bacterium NE2001]